MMAFPIDPRILQLIFETVKGKVREMWINAREKNLRRIGLGFMFEPKIIKPIGRKGKKSKKQKPTKDHVESAYKSGIGYRGPGRIVDVWGRDKDGKKIPLKPIPPPKKVKDVKVNPKEVKGGKVTLEKLSELEI